MNKVTEYLKDEARKAPVEVRNKYVDFIKTTITIFSGLIGILVAFKDKSYNSDLDSYLFPLIILLLSLNILFGLILLFGEVDTSRLFDRTVRKKLVEQLNDPQTNVHLYVPRKKIFDVIEKLFLGNIVLSFGMLTLYAFLIK